MTTSALRTTGLCKSFGSLIVAQDIAITLPRGARHALIGPNGAGKTTLINLITGALRPDSGHILLGEEDITALEPDHPLPPIQNRGRRLQPERESPDCQTATPRGTLHRKTGNCACVKTC